MSDEVSRSRQARAAAEQALVRVVHHYGARPEFVVLGGLVPELLCSGSSFQHAGTTDVDVQVNLEIACGAVNTARLEHALLNAEFQPDSDNIWRWRTDGSEGRAVVKFELLADLDSAAAETTVKFEECDRLGAANLRGTGYATRDVEVRTLTARVSGDTRTVEVNVTGLAGFLLAKCAAARSRRQPKDWYDIAFVLQHNDIGGPEAAARAVLEKFGAETRAFRSGLDDLLANFADRNAQGPQAYA
ncbi:MAG: nucleotidyl transferase AbiEii/AbiGii toxin family protein, partial [Woeseia sp.]